MSRFLPLSERSEVPSRGELWPLLLGALFACAVLAFAFHVAASARTPLVDDEALYRHPVPVIEAAPAPPTARAVVVKPEPKVSVRPHRRHAAARWSASRS